MNLGSTLRREGGLAAGYVTFALFAAFHDRLQQQGGWLQPLLFLWLFGVMLWCVLGVVRHAEAVAERLGEPLGTLILTLSAITIEVSLIAAVMLDGDSDPMLARDTMFAVLMILLNCVVGAALLIGALYHREQEFNFQGIGQFLSVLLPLSVFSLVLPRFTLTEGGAFDATQAAVFSVLIILLYGIFLVIQTVRHAAHFAEPGGTESPAHGETHAGEGYSLGLHAVLLLLFLLPVVLLAEEMAVYIDDGVEALHLPAALGGVVIAALVLSAESLASIKAARQNRLQRSINICVGSALSTIGLTAPVVLMIGLLAGEPVVLGLEPAEMVLLALTLVNCLVTFRGTRTSMLQGAVHLVLFIAYLALIFDP